MNNPTQEEMSLVPRSRQPRRSTFIALATVLTLHPLSLPPVKLDFHVTLDTRPYSEGLVRSAQAERN